MAHVPNVRRRCAILNDNREGNVYISVWIDPHGHVFGTEIQYSSDKVFKEEARRIASSLPDFIPGKNKGSNAYCEYMFEIDFKLPDKTDDISEAVTDTIAEAVEPPCDTIDVDLPSVLGHAIALPATERMRNPIHAMESVMSGLAMLNMQ